MAAITRVSLVARRILWRQLHTSPPPDPFLIAKLLGESEAGIRFTLSSMERSSTPPGPSFWEYLVAALGSVSPTKAQMVVGWRLERLLELDTKEQDHYSKLISSCVKLGDINLAVKIFTSMESKGIQPNTDVFNALVLVCSSKENLATALSLFEIMGRIEDCQPNLATYNTLISMYSKLRDIHGMMSWYSAAIRAGFSPDVQTYESLVSGFTRLGMFEDAEKFYKEMLASDILPNLVILNCMLEALCTRRDVDGAKGFLKSVIDGGWELTEAMVEKFLGLYLELRMVEDMEEFLDLVKPSTQVEILSRVHCGIIKLYALLDRLDDMEYSVGRMLKGEMIFTCSEDVETVVCAYFRQRAFTRLELFLDRIRHSYKLARSTYDLLVAGYRKFEMYERLDSVINEMKLAGFA